MGYLLDTHTFLWFVAGDNQLPKTVKDKISDITKPCFISVASFWEIAIKLQIGKLKLSVEFEELYRTAKKYQIEIIPINENHFIKLLSLDLIHNDPFDRLIIAQALAEKLILISKDKAFSKYKIKQQWS